MPAQTWRIDPATIERLHRQTRAGEWSLELEPFAAALERSARRYFGDDRPDAGDVERYLASLHLDDLAVACACAEGSNAAWDHFMREYRPVLYRAADALDPGGGARELADSLYGELFGLTLREGVRRSHFDYYHGRSTLGTWLRAVLSQRLVDRVRSVRRLDPLPDDDAPQAVVAPAPAVDGRWLRALELVRMALVAAVAALAPRDRLRLSCYYAQSMTLAQIGRVLGEHEGTVSRHLTRTRKLLRKHVEGHLRDRERLSEAEIAECLTAVAADTGTLDLTELLGRDQRRKEVVPERSKG
jgi:RNA polymerase sigma-70 factor (ECF subfamily)